MNKVLSVYYDNPNEASNTYLKYLTKDCEANDIEVQVSSNLKDWYTSDHKNTLFLEPTLEMPEAIKKSSVNIDNPSATATGIFNHIKDYPRDTTIGVIGRGLVGKPLINMLIDKGFTVIEMNSTTPHYKMFELCYKHCDIVIGVAIGEIFKEWECDVLNQNEVELIDASNNFSTKEKKRCGKWTREVIINRVLN